MEGLVLFFSLSVAAIPKISAVPGFEKVMTSLSGMLSRPAYSKVIIACSLSSDKSVVFSVAL